MNPLSSPLLTDLYQLTMLDTYLQAGMNELAVFEFFVRQLPPNRQFLVAAGLEQVLTFLENLHFNSEELAWVASCDDQRPTGGHRFSPALVDYLRDFKFTGDVYGMLEGTVFFPNEPILRIVAPLMQAQLIETRLINLLQFQTLIASKAVRCVLAAPAKVLIDFGLRRAHGAEAGLLAARASYIAGFAGTATVMAEPFFGIPIYGTMAHSFIQAHSNECLAFELFAQAQPGNVVLLIDTYNTEAGAHNVVKIAPKLKKQGISIKAVRLDSGNLLTHAKQVRDILDKGGLEEVGIFCSGGLDEENVSQLLSQNAPIDGFGLGSSLDTSSDAPYLDCAYKLQEYAGTARRKRSEGKATWPGRKQVFRYFDVDGKMEQDVLTLEGAISDGTPLIECFMRLGERTAPAETLDTIRLHMANQLNQLPAAFKLLNGSRQYEVSVSQSLQALAAQADLAVAQQEGN